MVKELLLQGGANNDVITIDSHGRGVILSAQTGFTSKYNSSKNEDIIF